MTLRAPLERYYLFRSGQVEEEVRDDQCLRRRVEEGRVAVGETVKEAVVRMSVYAYSRIGARLTNVGSTHNALVSVLEAVKSRGVG